MKIELDCFSCIFRQVLEAGRMSTDDEKLIRDILNHYANMIPEIKENDTAPGVVADIQKIIKEKTNKKDPYKDFKEKHIKWALKLYSDVKEIIESSDETLQAALIMSAMGNSIDAGVSLDVDIDSSIKNAVNRGFSYSDFNIFNEQLKKSKSLLIIADNAGEAVFDKLMIEEFNKYYNLDIIYAVRGEPILNDVTMKEAKKIGINNVCKLISSGCDTPGMILDRVNDNFENLFKNSDVIISKGQGNYEGLSEVKRPVFFLLKAKCDLIANKLGSGIKKGDLVFMLNNVKQC